MRKVFLSSVFLSLISFVATAQLQRTVLVEHFTQASCGPCASANPTVKSTIDNMANVVTIRYQTSWPGYDPMNLHNPSDVSARRNLYGVSGVPNLQVNGGVVSSASGLPNNFVHNQSAVTSTASATGAPISLDLDHFQVLKNGQLAIQADAKIKAAANFSGSHVLHVAIVEEEITFKSPPGSNGETEFYYVMKKLLPNATGESLSTLNTGDSVSYSYTWELSNVYDTDELAVVAWVQNTNNNDVVQAAYLGPQPAPVSIQPVNGYTLDVLDETGNAYFDFTIENNQFMDSDVVMDYDFSHLPSGLSASFSFKGSTYSKGDTLTIPASSSIMGQLHLSGKDSMGKVRELNVGVQFTNGRIAAFQRFQMATQNHTLFLNKVNSASLENTYLAAFYNATGQVDYTVVFPADNDRYDFINPRAFDSTSFKHVVVNSSNIDTNALSPMEANLYEHYLNSGGNLLMIGSDVGYDSFEGGLTPQGPKDFYEDFLGADYLNNGSSFIPYFSVVDQPYFPATIDGGNARMRILNGVTPDADQFDAKDTSSKIFLEFDNNNKGIGLYRQAFSDSGHLYKVVYVSTPFEHINPFALRDSLLSRAWIFFDNDYTLNTVSNKEQVQSAANLKVYPNPARDRVIVETEGETLRQLRIINLQGQTVRQIEINAAVPMTEFQTGDLEAGLYFIQAWGQNQELLNTEKLLISK